MILHQTVLSEYVKMLLARNVGSLICEGLGDKVDIDSNGCVHLTAETVKTLYSNLPEKDLSFIISGWISYSLKEMYSPNLFIVESYFHRKENGVEIDIFTESIN